MKIYGNLMNRIMEGGGPKPEVGMGATITHFSDRNAGTVVKTWIEKDKMYVQVQGDIATRIDKNGMSDSQNYSYKPNPNGGIGTWRAQVNAEGKQITAWQKVDPGVRKGTWKMDKSGAGLALGERDEHYDYGF